MLRFLTAGESHGPALVVTVEGLPAGLPIEIDAVANELARRRLGYGRGFYDRAIARQREAGRKPKLLGIAFAVQEVQGIPHEPHDVRLDWVVTDKEILDFTGMPVAGEG